MASTRRKPGQLGPQVEGYRAWLAHQGYTSQTVRNMLADLGQRGLDPLALRLAFLERRYRERLDLTWPGLTEADRTLRQWREQVADWATHPSRPMSAPHVAEIAGAFDDDLNAPAALAVLRDLASTADISPGAKFETFAHVDQLLGLDLVREVGR